MKVLWFTNTPSLYNSNYHNYFGGGWIESLEKLVRENSNIELAVSFFHDIDHGKIVKKNSIYYPIKKDDKRKNPFRSIIRNWRGGISKPKNLNSIFTDILSDYKPDLIQVFGTEGPLGLIQEITDTPVVYHLQGLINPCLNTYYPVNQSEINFFLNPDYLYQNIIGNSPAFGKKRFKNQADREKRLLSKAKFVMGRTSWDRIIAKLYNPEVEYYQIEEVLRPEFYKTDKIEITKKSVLQIISTLSPTVYKGIDVLLKTAQILKELIDIPFQWNVIGLEKGDTMLTHFEKALNMRHDQYNLVFQGKKNQNELVRLLKNSDVFVHPSYIDNSPNSVCEAQILGLPIIATNVGGISSLIEHNNTGFLVPANGVYEIVHYLKLLYLNPQIRISIGQSSKVEANKRHDRDRIMKDLMNSYEDIVLKL
jgi:glycosyltransferase involved in cell wall biosynthesis